MDCYTCDQPAINACKRCAKPYCDDHGNAVYCSECLQPSSALPSFNLYRGALLVMLVGTALAVVLILRPPGESKSASPVVVGKSGITPAATSGAPSATVAVKTPEASATPAETETPGTETPPAGTPTPGATSSGTASPFNEYVVQSGDNLLAIAQQFLAPGDDLRAFATAIANLNGLDPVDPLLRVGQKLLLPKPR
jgi:Tfp pilus assembly protein FimV